MNKNVKKIVMCFLIILVAGTIIPCFNSQAASKKKIKKAKAAYAKVLKKEKAGSGSYTIGNDIRFALVDVNKDGLPEMFVTGDGFYHATLLAYVNGKVKSVGGVFSGGYAVYPKRKVFYTSTMHSGYWIEEYYVFTGKKMKRVASKEGSDYENMVTGERKSYDNGEEITFEPFLYKVQDRVVTEKEFNNYIANLKQGKVAKINIKKYNNKNKKKYLQ